MKKAVIILGILLCETALIIGCIMIGAYVTTKAQQTEPLTIRKIAIVNLDEGVEINGERCYYATKFMNGSVGEMELAGLEQARKGLESNLYAAYIIIPAAFSKNVESVNKDPVRSTLSFKLNPGLETRTREEVIADITAFNSSLGTNMEYVYMDAILREVHNAQDGAQKLLENDLEDMKAVLKFAENEMIADPDYPTVERVDNDVASFDLSKVYADMQTLFTGLSNHYERAQEQAQAEYTAMVEGSQTISEQLEQVSDSISKTDELDNNLEFDLDNAEELDSYVENYNATLREWEQTCQEDAADAMSDYMDECQGRVAEQLDILSKKQTQHLKSYYADVFTELGEELQVSFDGVQNSSVQLQSDEEEIAQYNISIQDMEFFQKFMKDYYVEKGKMLCDMCLLEAEVNENRIKEAEENEAENPDPFRENLEVEMVHYSRKYANGDFSEFFSMIPKETIENVPTSVLEGVIKGYVDSHIMANTNAEGKSFLQNDIREIIKTVEKKKSQLYQLRFADWLQKDMDYYENRQEDSLRSLKEEAAWNLLDENNPQSVAFTSEQLEEIWEYFDMEVPEVLVEEPLQEDVNETEDTEQEGTGENPAEGIEEDAPLTQWQRRNAAYRDILFSGSSELCMLDGQDLKDVVEDEVEDMVLSPISDSIYNQYQLMTDSYGYLKDIWDGFSARMRDYTVDSFGKQDERDAMEETFDKNMIEVQETVSAKGQEYQEYVTKANEANEKNLTAWEESIQKANEKTHANVESNLKNIKESRETLNKSNSDLMNGLLGTLPYTRLGNLENTKVYSYITNPLEFEDLSEQPVEQEKGEEDRKTGDDWEKMLVLLCAGACLLGSTLLIHRMYKRHKALHKQDLS